MSNIPTSQNTHLITGIIPGSIAEELELEVGDSLISIDGESVEDIFDYRYLINEEYLTVLIRKASGEEWELEIEKEYEEDLGLLFENSLMDEYRSCRNHCIFCFIDQLPKGMRSSLYFKDDDSRLSFLQGNYLTLTNLSEQDLDRIIKYHLEPINISFQAMNPQLRCKMLHNRFAGEVFAKVKRLCDAGIRMNGQIVLCKNVNDGEELRYSLQAMEEYLPSLQSVSVVPVGLTKYRDGLYPLKPFTKEDAQAVLSEIHSWQDYYYGRYGTHLVHGGDEWYLLADWPIPEEENYDGYLQLENGVGMIRLLLEETDACLAERDGSNVKSSCAIATGKIAAPFLAGIIQKLKQKYPNVQVNLYPIENAFFGERITVAGLLTGQDLKMQLAGKDLGDRLLLSRSMFKSGEDIFLDDVSVSDLEEALQTRVRIVESDGRDLIEACLGH